MSAPTTDAGFNPGITAAPSSTPTLADQTDNASNEFAGGTSTGTSWDATNSYLKLDHSGSATDLELDPSWTPASSNLVGYWKLNEANGATTVNDSSPLGTNSGTPLNVTFGSAGMLNTAATFNGSSLIQINSNVTGSATSITMAAWIYPTSTAAPQMVFFNNGNQSYNTGTGYFIDFHGDTVHCGTDNQYDISVASIPQNAWTYIACTISGTTASIYINGQFDSSSVTGPVNENTSNLFFIGYGGSSNGWPFYGTIDDAAVWNTALSASAIASIYQHESSKKAGTFTSRVMDGFTSSANWTNFSWIPTLPFFKELPDGGSSETQANYSSQSANLMNGIVGLWHLDESSGNSIDSSGNNHNGTASGTLILGASGKFNKGIDFSSAAAGAVTHIDVGSFNPVSMNNAMTLSFWYQWKGLNGSYQCFAANRAGGVNWQIFMDSGNNNVHVNGNSYGSQTSSGSIPSDSLWHHYVFAQDGSLAIQYLDGVQLTSDAAIALTGTSGLPIVFGDCHDDSHFNGTLDEIALWSRGLNAVEVSDLYRRGANRIKYQLRTCSDATCTSGSPQWQGPDNTNQTYFSELNNTLANAASASVQAGLPFMDFSSFSHLFVPQDRYFQYRAIMESDDAESGCDYGTGPTWCSPELRSVSAGPIHQQ